MGAKKTYQFPVVVSDIEDNKHSICSNEIELNKELKKICSEYNDDYIDECIEIRELGRNIEYIVKTDTSIEIEGKIK